MPSTRTHLDYYSAIQQAAAGRIGAYPQAIASVLRARLKYGLGPRMYSLFRLYDAPPDTWDRFLLDERLRVRLRRLNPAEHRVVVNDKRKFFEHCLDNELPTIPVLCTLDPVAQEDAIAIDAARLSVPHSFLDALNGQDRIFLKLTGGTWGTHAFVAARYENTWEFGDRKGSAEELYRYCMEIVDGKLSWIIQPVIGVHPELRRVTSPFALSTIRVVSCLVNGEPRIQYAVLRISVGENVIDNFTHGTSGNILAPVNLQSGALGRAVGSSDRGWPTIVEYARHPDTQQAIEGFVIPYWDEARDLLLRAHSSLPKLKTLGWDLAVTDKGPVIVEANPTYDVDLIQVAYAKGIASELLPLLESA